MKPESEAWLIGVVDPFHDSDFRPTDKPDFARNSVIVQDIKRTYSVSAPPNLADGALWDFNLALLPHDSRTTFLSSSAYNGSLAPPAALTIGGTPWSNEAMTFGGWTLHTVPTGQKTFQPQNTWPAAIANQNMVSLAADSTLSGAAAAPYLRGTHRYVYTAVEIKNTTAELYKNGSILCYRQPLSAKEKCVSTYDAAGTVQYAEQCLIYRSPPTSVDEAQLLEGTRTYGAEEGAYVVATQATDETSYKDTDQMRPVMVGSDLNSGDVAGVALVDNIPALTAFGSGSTLPTFGKASSRTTFQPWNISGVYGFGLTKQSTFQLTVCYGVARAPTLDEADLVVLAAPSPLYDPVALEIYSQAMRVMPAGVPVNENPLGEWFTKVIDGIGSVGSAVAPMIGAAHPMAGAVVNMAARGAKGLAAKRKAKGK